MRDYAKKSQILDERIEPKLYGDTLSFGVGAGSAKSKSHKPTRKITKKTNPAAKRRALIIMAIVLIIAFAIGYRIYSIHQRFHPQTAQEWLQAFTNHKKLSVSKKEEKAEAPAQPTGPTFDFYTVLPSNKVVLNAPQDKAADSDPAKAAPIPVKHQFILQVAAYATRQQAQDMRTRLELMDLAPIITVSSEHGKLLYRVNLGPYSSKEAADNVRQQIQQQGVLGSNVQALD